jgi:hypothetical protein
MWSKLPVLSTTLQFLFSILITWGVVKGFFFDRKQFETRPNVWPGTIVRLRQLMASDGPVVNIKMTRHGYDDVIREFAKRVVDTSWTAAGSSVAWDRRSSGECRLIQLLPVPPLF